MSRTMGLVAGVIALVGCGGTAPPLAPRQANADMARAADACAGIVCDHPPADVCVDAGTVRHYSSAGTCSNGGCDYAHSDSACVFGCANAACLATDPCAGVTCNSPPATTCVDGLTLRSYSASGTCTGGSCDYGYQDTSCHYGFCANAACPPHCVAGTSSACTASGMQWNGTQCCTNDFPLTCSAGTAVACTGKGMHWTGSTCCVSGATQCVDGDSADCSAFAAWTGSQCCVGYAPGACSSGESTRDECFNSNGKWTGAVCCIP